jgi:hypothetical protein
MAHQGGKDFEPGIIDRVSGAVSWLVTGKVPAWFGPNQPLAPVAPKEVEGRAFDYPVGVNLNYMPRSEQSESGVSFATLRAIADPALGGLDLVRLAVETRKDQMEAQRWTIRGLDGKDAGDRGKKAMGLFRRPDGVHTFRQWARQLWEDLLVIDAPSVYIDRGMPEIIDGGSIKLLSDPNGRRPIPPLPAFQHVLKGMPAVDYTADQLIYFPRNLRSNKFYGMSPVEQLINIIQLALKRQLSLTAVYTAGNVPEHLIGVPESWNPKQIELAQQYMDALMQGNIEAKRKALFVPGGMQPIKLGDPTMHEGFDEWLARLICWCFSIPPTALVRQVNRATAETAQIQAQQEGLEPLKEWWKDFMNEILVKCYGITDLEFGWLDAEIVNPQIKVQTASMACGGSAFMTKDEVRTTFYGLDPLTPEQKEELAPKPVDPFGGMFGVGQEQPKKDGEDIPKEEPEEKIAKRRLLQADQPERKGCTCGNCQNTSSKQKIPRQYP